MKLHTNLPKVLCAFVLLCFATAPSASAQQNNNGVFPYPIHTKKLANGMEVIAIPFDSPGLMTYSQVVRVGSRNEVEEGVTGFAHFFEHLMFYGSKKRGQAEIDRVSKSMGAGGNANTTNDRTFYYLTGNAAKIETFFDLYSENFRNLYFSVEDFKKQAGAVLGEYTKNYSGWYRQMDAEVRRLSFKKHTYGHSTMGYEKDIKDMPNQYDYAWTFYERFYRPEYITVIVVGDIDPDQVFELAEKYYGDWERGGYTADIEQEPAQEKEITGRIERGDVLPSLMMTYRTPAYAANLKETVSLEIIATLLGSQRSDLYQKLVNESQMAKGFFAFDGQSIDPRYFSIIVRADRGKEENLALMQKDIENAIETIKNKPQDAQLLADIKSNRKYGFLGSLNNPQSIASTIASYYQLTGDANAINSYFETLEAVTADDIMRTAKKYFIKKHRTVVIMSGDENGAL